ncbi:MAG: SusD/RagB family nutrient-binding outer membrane lipoprotein, partial [Cyclobacteriaceae bacterium]|nr:SusD/RagB family nutrient-binding outer membrane lipoprotein [Cyclobacteriaceae bacterium]
VLKGYEDPRMPEFFSPALNGHQDGDGVPFEGLRNGQLKNDMNQEMNLNHSDVGPRFAPNTLTEYWPIPVIRAAETYFLRAEGALEGWSMGGTAQDLYETGIEMSITEFTSANQGIIEAYITSSNTPAAVDDAWDTPPLSDIPVAYDASGSAERQLEQIITQKWLALYPDGWEAWAELRRTGYPKVYDRLNSDDPQIDVGEIMRRMVFVSTEFDTNEDAVEAAIASPELGGNDKGLTKVWWDKK